MMLDYLVGLWVTNGRTLGGVERGYGYCGCGGGCQEQEYVDLF